MNLESMLNERPDTKGHIMYEMSRIGKSAGTEISLMVARGNREKGWGSNC
jgi:hypothetical protein